MRKRNPMYQMPYIPGIQAAQEPQEKPDAYAVAWWAKTRTIGLGEVTLTAGGGTGTLSYTSTVGDRRILRLVLTACTAAGADGSHAVSVTDVIVGEESVQWGSSMPLRAYGEDREPGPDFLARLRGSSNIKVALKNLSDGTLGSAVTVTGYIEVED